MVIEDWEGPDEKVDIVLVAHSMYYMSGPRSKILDRFLSWIKPTGMVVILLEDVNFITHTSKCDTWKIKNQMYFLFILCNNIIRYKFAHFYN